MDLTVRDITFDDGSNFIYYRLMTKLMTKF